MTTQTHRTVHHEQAAHGESFIETLTTKLKLAREHTDMHHLAALVADLDADHADNPPASITVLRWSDEVGEGEPYLVTCDEVLDAGGEVLETIGGEVSWTADPANPLFGWADERGDLDVAKIRRWASTWA